MSDLKGKKLLILGGNRPSVEIVKEARKLGVYTIVTDWYDTQRSPAKLEADEYWNEEVFRPDLLAELVKEKHIDGILTGYTDSYLKPYIELCEIVNFYHWGDKNNIELSVNKEAFKRACEKSGVPVVPWKILSKDNFESNLDDIVVPVVIKPIDNSGSRGVYKCYEKSTLKSLCKESLSFSQSGEIMIERLMDLNNEFSAYYLICHGNAILTGMGDRYIYEINPELAPVGQGMLFPSTRLDQWIAEMNPLIKNLFRDNRMDEGFVFVQGFYDNGRFYIHEIGYRLNGGFSFRLVEHFCGYNQIQQLIRFSLSGEMTLSEISQSDPRCGGNYGMIFTASLRKGTISRIEGIQEINELHNVIEFYQMKNIGATISTEGTTAEAFAYIMLSANDKKQLLETIERIKSLLHVYDENNNEMLFPLIDEKRLIF